MTLVHDTPFEARTLEDEREGEIISVRLNKKERVWLDEIKVALNIPSDGKALKVSALMGKNVIHTLLPPQILKYLSRTDRAKLEL